MSAEPVPRAGTTVCRSAACRAPIRMVTLDTGAEMPVDVEPSPAGNMALVRVPGGGWRMHVLQAGEDPQDDPRRWTSHFATCSRAGDHRKPKPKPRFTVLEGGADPRRVTAELVRTGILQLVADGEAPRAATGPVTAEVAPSLAAVGSRTCGKCGVTCPGAMPSLEDGTPVLLDAEGGLYDRLAVRAGGRWVVRVVDPLEQNLPLPNRRQAHQCRVLPLVCQTPSHAGVPARLYPGGAFCGDCASLRSPGSAR